MSDKKTYALSISKTNDDGTTSNVSLNTPYADEVMALLRLSGVSAPAVTPGPIEVVADPHTMEPCDVDVVATEEYANEPNGTHYDNQTVSNFSLKRNMQKMNDVGNYRGDNKLGDVTESLESKYAAFEKKELTEAKDRQLSLPFEKPPKNKLVPVTLKFKKGSPTSAIHNMGGNMAKHIAKSNRAEYQGGQIGDKTIHYYKVPKTRADDFRGEIKRNVKYIDKVTEDQATSQEAYKEITQLIKDILVKKYKGKAWFKGGSYSYLLDVTKPNMMQASDGAVVKVQNFAAGLQDYCDDGIVDDIFDNWEYLEHADLLEYFRPFNAVRDQESHELANMRGD